MRTCIVVLLALMAGSCSRSNPTPIPEVTNYFPLRKGLYQVYQVDSVAIDQNAETDYTFELKTEVTDSFPSASGGYTYAISRSKRLTPSSPWVAVGTWSARVTAFQAVVDEGNTPFVKIEGPLVNGKTWNGNAFNDLGGTQKCPNGTDYTCDNYAIDGLGKAYQASQTQSFDDTMTVIEEDNQDLIVFLDNRSEVYARNVGLIYREFVNLSYCTDQNCLGTQFVTKGVRYKQTISDYGL